jgi:hypothetical protein
MSRPSNLLLALLCAAPASHAQRPAVHRATTFGRVLAANVTGRNTLQAQSRDGIAVTKSGLACMLVSRDDAEGTDRSHLELYHSGNEGLAWTLLGELETKGDRAGAIAADPRREAVHIIWSAHGADDFESVWYVQADTTSARFTGRPQLVLRGAGLAAGYSAEDVCVAADGTVVAGVRAGAKALATGGLPPGALGLCLLRPGAKQWAAPIRLSERAARDLCLAGAGDAVHALWRETSEESARHRTFDPATGSFRDSGSHPVAFGAEDKTRLLPGLSLCADAAGNLYALGAIAAERAGQGQIVLGYAPGPGCASWSATVLAKDSLLVTQAQPPPFCVAQHTASEVLALWSQADMGHRELHAAVLCEGKAKADPAVIANEKVGGPFLGISAGRAVTPGAGAIDAVAGLGGTGAASLVSVITAKPPAVAKAPTSQPKPPAEKPVAPAQDLTMAEPPATRPAREPQPAPKKEPRPLAGIYAERTDGRARLAKNRPFKNADGAITSALAWLAKHQDEDGHFDAAAFTKHDAGDPSGGLGKAEREVGVTALALLAFLADGNTLDRGPLAARVNAAVDWLMHRQKPDGLLGEQDHEDFLIDHALATHALAEAAGSSRNTEVKAAAQKAVDRLQAHRKDGAAFAKAPQGDAAETLLTAWCVQALWTAREAELRVDPKSLADAQGYMLLATDPESGRCAASRAELAQRSAKTGFFVPPVETATAAALLCRALLGESAQGTPTLRKGIGLVRNQQPEWDARRGKIDFAGWFYGAHALRELDPAVFSEWQERLVQTLVGSQRRDRTAAGSWDSDGDPSAMALGRIGATALGVLALAAPYRIARPGPEPGAQEQGK